MSVLVKISAAGMDQAAYDQMVPVVHPLLRNNLASSFTSRIRFPADSLSTRSGRAKLNMKPGLTNS